MPSLARMTLLFGARNLGTDDGGGTSAGGGVSDTARSSERMAV
jgi:hypothetical protein